MLILRAAVLCGLLFADVTRSQAQTTDIAIAGIDAGESYGSPDGRYADQISPLLAKYCIACHGPTKQEDDLRLDHIVPKFDAAGAKHWRRIVERVELGQMPPESEPRPTTEEVHRLATWVEEESRAVELDRRGKEGRVVLRRLNRIEYENTVRDLLSIEVDLKEQLPQDGSADGFDNAGAAMHTSSFLMEKYLEAADTALNIAISNRPTPPPLISKRYSLRDGHPIRGTTEDVYRFLEDGEVVCFCSSEWHNVGISTFYPPDAGNYRFRISASSIQSEGKPVTFRVTTSGTRLTGKSGLVSYFDAPPDNPTVFEFVRHMEPRNTINILPYGLAGANTVKQVGGKDWNGSGLAVQFVEVEGPLHETWPPESHRRIFGALPQKTFGIYNFSDRVEVVSDRPLQDAARILRDFAQRAFRRPVTDDETQPFLDVVTAKLAADCTFEQSIRAALKGILLSPEFLFLRETPGQLSNHALACRLSYFLWSTMPDDALLELASHGTLSDAAELHRQVERMLQHPRAAALTENFVGQWLGLRDIDLTEPSHILYPAFDHLLKVSMIGEAETFFEEVLTQNLSLTNFTASDFTMLNGCLAKHYGTPAIDGWNFRKVSLPPGSHRGGVLTMASVLKVTANGTSTSPVIRGAWVLDRILGTPPAPPPDNVSALDPDIRGATTIREQLAKHRDSASCASCHSRIDPPGFALESFDCIGGFREYYVLDGRPANFRKGLKVDPSGVTEDGQPFADIDEFKKLLLRDKDRLARALTTKLLTYATGTAPTTIDRAEIDAIVGRIREHDYGLRSLVHEIVQSKLFRNK